jgi:hypothetical protein
LVDALAASPLGSRWLTHLAGCTTIHSSAPTAVDNARHRLADLGLRSGDACLDALVAPWRARLAAPTVEYGTPGRVVLAAALAHAGYRDDPVLAVADRRLALIRRDGWRLPAALLPEHDGYWVSAAHLGLEDDRRRRAAPEVESTLRVLDAAVGP